MRFYLACVTIFAVMLFGLRACGAVEYMAVTQASAHLTEQGKGGEAKRETPKRFKRYGRTSSHRRLKIAALSVAFPRPRPLIELPHAESCPAPAALWTPQHIINDAFELIGWKQ